MKKFYLNLFYLIPSRTKTIVKYYLLKINNVILSDSMLLYNQHHYPHIIRIKSIMRHSAVFRGIRMLCFNISVLYEERRANNMG